MIDINQADFDFDLEPETAFLDLDNDGTYEIVAQGFDTDADGQLDIWAMQTDYDGDGIADQTSVIQGLDTNEDGQIDTWQIQTDYDGDGIADQTSVIQGIDTNEDGQIDTWQMQTDYDGDFIPDEVAFAADTDFDGLPDTLTQQWDGDSTNVIGDPASDLEHWHEQAYSDTCAIASQEFILDELTGVDFSEDQLRQEACANGWYIPGGGTPPNCMGNLLEAHGIPVERHLGGTLDDLSEKLTQGEKVMVAVDAGEIINAANNFDDLISDFIGIPGQKANHAVQVVGIDCQDPDNPMVILNDPGHGAGQGLSVPAQQFLDAWEDSGRFMVSTVSRSTVAQQNEGDAPMLGGYYNADGTYHYTSDNTDRDPETEAVVRQW